MRPYVLGAAALVIAFGLSPGLFAQVPDPNQTTPQPATTTAQVPQAADQTSTPNCSDCHEQAAAFTGNPHALGHVTAGHVPNSVCESCHGNGQAHMEAGGDKSLIVKPAGRSGSEICVKCHGMNTPKRSPQTGMHANTETVNCLSCHSVHNSNFRAGHLLVRDELSLCDTCHSTQVADFKNKPYAHRLGRGGMNCSSCHEPHGRPVAQGFQSTRNGSMKMMASGDSPCLGCHTDKRGPFVFNHGGVAVADCTACHAPHGSNNPKRLIRSTVMQVCLECHSVTAAHGLGSQPPAFHNVAQARYQNCTTCHTAIHGSNRSPQLFK